jgi:hypothetical protein
MTKYDHLFLSGLSDIVVNAWGGQWQTIGKSALAAEKSAILRAGMITALSQVKPT